MEKKKHKWQRKNRLNELHQNLKLQFFKGHHHFWGSNTHTVITVMKTVWYTWTLLREYAVNVPTTQTHTKIIMWHDAGVSYSYGINHFVIYKCIKPTSC